MRTLGHCRARARALEIAIRKAETAERATEAVGVVLNQVEARLDRQAFQRGAGAAIVANLERAGRQEGTAHRTVTANLDGANDGAIRKDAAGAFGALKAGVGEKL